MNELKVFLNYKSRIEELEKELYRMKRLLAASRSETKRYRRLFRNKTKPLPKKYKAIEMIEERKRTGAKLNLKEVAYLCDISYEYCLELSCLVGKGV